MKKGGSRSMPRTLTGTQKKQLSAAQAKIFPQAFRGQGVMMLALLISNLSVLTLGVTFANVMGSSMGDILTTSSEVRVEKALAAARKIAPNEGGPGGGTLRITPVDTKGILTEYGGSATVASFVATASGDAMNLRRLEFIPTTATDYFGTFLEAQLSRVSSDGSSVVIGTAPIGLVPIVVFLPAAEVIPAGISQKYSVQLTFAEPGIGRVSGATFQMQLSGISTTGVGNPTSPVTIFGVGSVFNEFSLFKTLGTVTILYSSVTKEIGAPENLDLTKMSVTASPRGPVGLSELTFAIDRPNVVDVNNLYLYESDSSGSLGNLIASNHDITQVPLSGSGTVKARFDVDNNDARFHDSPGITESLMILPGYTKYFTLRGWVPTSTPGTVITTLLKQDVLGRSGVRKNVLRVEQTAPSSHVVWSDFNFDLFASSSATATNGWFNGFRFPGL